MKLAMIRYLGISRSCGSFGLSFAKRFDYEQWTCSLLGSLLGAVLSLGAIGLAVPNKVFCTRLLVQRLVFPRASSNCHQEVVWNLEPIGPILPQTGTIRSCYCRRRPAVYSVMNGMLDFELHICQSKPECRPQPVIVGKNFQVSISCRLYMCPEPVDMDETHHD